MELVYKPDYEDLRERWAAFWRGESPRPLLYAIQPKLGVDPIRKPRPYDCAFGDLDPIIDQVLGWAASHEFLADSIPSFMVTFAPDHFAALLKAADIRRIWETFRSRKLFFHTTPEQLAQLPWPLQNDVKRKVV